jgi:DNA primase
MDFYTTALTSDLDLRSGKGKAEAVARLAPLLAQIANPVEQAHHIQQIARLIQVDEQVVRQTLPAPERKAQRPKPAAPPIAGAPAQEDHMLGWLLRYPAARTAVQEKIRRDLLPFPLVESMIQGTLLELLERVENRAIWQAWQAQPPGTSALEWVEMLDDALRQQAERALSLDIPHPQAYRYVNDALECARMLQLDLARRWKKRITEEAHSAAEHTDQIAAHERLAQLIDYMNTLSVPKRSSAYDDLHSLHAV